MSHHIPEDQKRRGNLHIDGTYWVDQYAEVIEEATLPLIFKWDDDNPGSRAHGLLYFKIHDANSDEALMDGFADPADKEMEAYFLDVCNLLVRNRGKQ